MGKRRYTLRRRATQQEETRARIVDAAMALHEELGPAATTISAIADRAGVQRLTVYRHFARDEDLFAACSSRWMGLHPPPDPATTVAGDAAAQTRDTLRALYAYYRQTQRMWKSVYRDADLLPALAAPLAEFEAYLSAVGERLLEAWPSRRSRQLTITLRHALKFSTWRSLQELGLGDRAMAELAGAWVAEVARADPPGRGRAS